MRKRTGQKNLALVLVLLLTLLCVTGCGKKEEPTEEPENNSGMGFRIGYAEEGVMVTTNENEMQKAYDEMVKATQEGYMALSYKESAYSENGIDFDCYIANADSNKYDMFIAIYSDPEFTDELYLSQLLRPGTAFNSITLNHALEPGSHTVYVAYTQIEEADGEQSIHAQSVVTMQFTVEE